MAGRLQTIDVYGGSTDTAISSGGFRIAYGTDAEVVTTCIPGNDTQLTAGVVSSAFESANSQLNVTVEEDDSPYDGARRFVVYFENPDLGVGTLELAEEEEEEEDCPWFRCSEGGNDQEDEACDEEYGVVINRDTSVSVQEGAIEVSQRVPWCFMCHRLSRTD